MTRDTRTLKLLIERIRRCFWRMAAVADAALQDLGLSASLRAVMEHLDDHGPATVPQIAAAKTVRRQSIQELVDRLHGEGLVKFSHNPAHRRSPLVALSRKGKLLFAQVRVRDERLLRQISDLLPDPDLAAAIAVLSALHSALETIDGAHHAD